MNKEIKFETVESGNVCGIEDKLYYVIYNGEDWQNLWERVHSNVFPIPELPKIDFNNEMIITLFAGEKQCGGYSINIVFIEETEDTLSILSNEKSHQECGVTVTMMSYPFCIVKCEKCNKTPVFISYNGLFKDSCESE